MLGTELFSRLLAQEQLALPDCPPALLEKRLRESLPVCARLTACEDEAYPAELAALDGHPDVLVSAGDLSLTERQLRIAVVGSRNAGEADLQTAFETARSLAERGAVIVSGLAAGVDRAAHSGALSAGTAQGTPGRTVGVMGTPLSAPWPLPLQLLTLLFAAAFATALSLLLFYLLRRILPRASSLLTGVRA